MTCKAYGLRMSEVMWVWVLDAVILVLFGLALLRFQTARDTSGRVVAGIAAPMLGFMGISVFTALLF